MSSSLENNIGGGLVVSMVAFYPNDHSLNPTKVCNSFIFKNVAFKEQKEAGIKL